MTDVLKIHFKSLKYAIGKLTEAWRTPVSYDSSVVSRYGCRPLPTSFMKRFLSFVVGFASTSIRNIFNNYDINDNNRHLDGSKKLMVFDE